MIDGGVMEDEVARDAEESLFAEEDLEERAGPGGFDSGGGEGFVEGWDGESGGLESGLDAGAGFGFVVLEDYAVGAMADDIAFDLDLRMIEDRVHQRQGKAIAQGLFRNPGQQRIQPVELLDAVDHGGSESIHPQLVDEPTVESENRLVAADSRFDLTGEQAGAGREFFGGHACTGFADEQFDPFGGRCLFDFGKAFARG